MNTVLRLNPRHQWASWALVPTAMLIALIFGLASVILPWFLVIGAALVLVLAPTFILRPQWLLVPVVAFQMYAPSQPVADVVTVLYMLRCLAPLSQRWKEQGPLLAGKLMWPVYAIVLIAVLSLAVGIALGHDRSRLYGDGRVFVYWFWIIPLLAFAPAKDSGRWFARQLLAIAVLVALLAVVQGSLGISLVSTGRVGALDSLSASADTVTRVQIPGFVFVMFGLFYSAARLVKPGSAFTERALYLGALLLLSLAIYYNFGRAIWFWSVLGLAITAVMLGWRASVKATLLGVVIVVTVGTALSIAKPVLLDTMTDRVLSVFDEGGSQSSLGWRIAENRLARKKLADSAYLGMALGGEYRMPVFGLRGFENHTSYIHNGHLSVMLRLGIVGYLAYVVLFVAMGLSLLKARRHPAQGALAAASMAWLLTFVGQNITQPDILSAHGVMLLVSLLVLSQMQARERG